MARSALCWMVFLLLLGSGCATSLHESAGSARAPNLSLSLLRKDKTTGAMGPSSPDKILGATEGVTLEIAVDRPAYVSAALYSATGSSEELSGDAAVPVRPDRPLRVEVPRRAPPGVKETELRIIIAASTAPIAPAVRQLLHLPCSVQGRRGDPEPEKPKDDKSQGSRTASGQGGQPKEEGPRGGDRPPEICPSPAELTAPLNVRALVLRSE